jgi:PKD repeat protein
MRKFLALATAVVLPLAAGCAVHQDSAPSPSGPAEQALSLKLTATPDHIVQDGSQSAKVAITAFDAGGHPITVQVQLFVSPAGFGTLSSSTIATTTDASKPTTVTYFPPASTSGNGATVTIGASTVGPNATGNSIQQVSVIVAPAAGLSASAPSATFTVSPPAVVLGKPVTFDGSSSCPVQLVGGACPANSGSIVSAVWSFGDNSTGSGISATHTYTAANTYTATLTVQNDKGLTASSSQTVVVSAPGQIAPPTPNFTFSPSSPGVGDTVFFNASTSTAASGHSIASYTWNFGDGGTGTGATPSPQYSVSATYNVQLTVTDDLGQSTTSTPTALAIGSPPAPTASFTSSPVTPTIVDSIVFDASSSSTAQGQTITKLAWNFGDGSSIINCPGDGACVGTRVITHTYSSTATYVVNLVVTDSAGRIGSHNATVTVISGNPEPLLTASPNSGTHPLLINFSSAGSKLYNGATVSSYAWDFGDGGTSTLANPSHTFSSAGTFTVRLTITDSKSRSGTATITVTIS